MSKIEELDDMDWQQIRGAVGTQICCALEMGADDWADYLRQLTKKLRAVIEERGMR